MKIKDKLKFTFLSYFGSWQNIYFLNVSNVYKKNYFEPISLVSVSVGALHMYTQFGSLRVTIKPGFFLYSKVN